MARKLLSPTFRHLGENMSRQKSFQDLFLVEARELYGAEEQLMKVLPTLADAATSDKLRAAIQTQREETRTHIQRLEEVFELLDEEPGGQHCSGMAVILQEVEYVLDHEDVQVRGTSASWRSPSASCATRVARTDRLSPRHCRNRCHPQTNT
jgi:hypothetical protein